MVNNLNYNSAIQITASYCDYKTFNFSSVNLGINLDLLEINLKTKFIMVVQKYLHSFKRDLCYALIIMVIINAIINYFDSNSQKYYFVLD